MLPLRTALGLRDLYQAGLTRQEITQRLKDGSLKRLLPRVYAVPVMNPLTGHMFSGVSLEHASQKWAKERGRRVAPISATAANMLGLSTQVVVRVMWALEGCQSSFSVGKVIFVPAPAWVFALSGAGQLLAQGFLEMAPSPRFWKGFAPRVIDPKRFCTELQDDLAHRDLPADMRRSFQKAIDVLETHLLSFAAANP